MKNLLTRLNVLLLTFGNWMTEQPHNVRWAVNCALIGAVILVIEAIFVLAGVWNWPIILITIVFFGIGIVTLDSSEFWEGPGGD